MTALTASRMAWSMWAITVALVGAGLGLGLAFRDEGPLYGYWLESALINPTFATVGALIASRRHRNAIGWIFSAGSVCGGIQMLSGQYATTALLVPHARLPGGDVAGWLSGIMQVVVVISLLFVLLLFPTGKPPTRRWRAAIWATVAVAALFGVSTALRPGPVESLPHADNPFAAEALRPVMEVAAALGNWGGVVVAILAVASVIARFRRARGAERLQLKWFAYAASVGLAAIMLAGETALGSLVWTIAPLGLVAAIGIAILRYRLYDIDRLINRTLVYAALSALLASVYLGGVVGVGGLVRQVTAGDESNSLVVAAATLAVAAVFRPARARVQTFIDRRFYRHKYDVEQTLEDFSLRLRDQLDLDALNAELLHVVRDTMQPTHVSLWLRRDVAPARSAAPSA